MNEVYFVEQMYYDQERRLIRLDVKDSDESAREYPTKHIYAFDTGDVEKKKIARTSYVHMRLKNFKSGQKENVNRIPNLAQKLNR